MYHRKNGIKTGILTNKERDCLANPSNIPRDNKGTTKKNIDNKSFALDEFDLFFDLIHILPKEKLTQLTKRLMLFLPHNERKYLFEYQGYLPKKYKENEKYNKENSKKSKQFKKVLKKIGTKNLTLDEIHSLERLDSSKLKKGINRIYKSETFILRRKMSSDVEFILNKRKGREIFRFIYHIKKPFKIDILYKKFPKEKYILQFYERGIILPVGKSKKDFISKCRKLIKSKEAKEISKFFQEYEIYPFIKKVDKVKLNPYYDFFQLDEKIFHRGSSTYYSLKQQLRSLLIDDPTDYPEEFYPTSSPNDYPEDSYPTDDKTNI